MKYTKILIISSLILFCLITKNGNHISLPMIVGLISGLVYFFKNPELHIIAVLSTLGLIILIFSIIKKRFNNWKYILIGYLLTYLILVINLLHESVINNIQKQKFFIISICLYFILSIVVIIRTYSFQKK